ncbi:hypothetical protein LP417_08295 [Polaromonas sp. P1-6]|nr:hypothetical protein LP417_08295 [Polaromonas sp. P1-6]
MGRHAQRHLAPESQPGAQQQGDITVQAETAQGTSARVAAGVKQARVSLVSEGDALTLALRWDSERRGHGRWSTQNPAGARACR